MKKLLVYNIRIPQLQTTTSKPKLCTL